MFRYLDASSTLLSSHEGPVSLPRELYAMNNNVILTIRVGNIVEGSIGPHNP